MQLRVCPSNITLLQKSETAKISKNIFSKKYKKLVFRQEKQSSSINVNSYQIFQKKFSKKYKKFVL